MNDLTSLDATALPPPLAADERPARLVARFVSEIQMAVMTTALETMEAHGEKSVDHDRAVVLMVVMRASLSQPACADPDDDQGAISMNAMAQSLGRPFETIRRHTNSLIASGICQRGRRGISICPAFAAGPELQRTMRRIHDLMVLLISYLHGHGVPLPNRRTDLAYDWQATMAAALDLMLAAVEYLAPHYSDWMEMRLVTAVMIANARQITFDPVLAQRFSTYATVAPDSLRLPVGIAKIARALHVPYSTAQRYATRAIAEGKLKRVPGGVMVTGQLLRDSAVAVAGPTATARAQRAFARLVAGGFPFDDPASAYLDGPPNLIDFGVGGHHLR